MDEENEPIRKFTWGKDGDGYLQSFRITSNAEKGKGTSRGTESAGLNPLSKKKIKETIKVESSGSGVRVIALGDKPVNENNKGGGSLAENKVGNETAPKAKNDETGGSTALGWAVRLDGKIFIHAPSEIKETVGMIYLN